MQLERELPPTAMLLTLLPLLLLDLLRLVFLDRSNNVAD